MVCREYVEQGGYVLEAQIRPLPLDVSQAEVERLYVAEG
ncbi:hypothetical protein KSAC_32670 (plasmid) [Komagataeibacter saccharivorans]|nr:hypothetical protein KSAC_32670 [Komagataeibacter saccharivorans]